MLQWHWHEGTSVLGFSFVLIWTGFYPHLTGCLFTVFYENNNWFVCKHLYLCPWSLEFTANLCKSHSHSASTCSWLCMEGKTVHRCIKWICRNSIICTHAHSNIPPVQHISNLYYESTMWLNFHIKILHFVSFLSHIPVFISNSVGQQLPKKERFS